MVQFASYLRRVLCKTRLIFPRINGPIVGKGEFLWANHYAKIFCFCVHSGAPDLIYPETSLYEQIL